MPQIEIRGTIAEDCHPRAEWNLRSYHPGKEDPQVGQARSLTVKACQAESLTDFSAGVIFEWAHEDSNLGPHPYQGCALAV